MSLTRTGAGDSQGDIVIMGKQEGEDGHDVIEALAKMDWFVLY
jgi:predicted acyl esterase